MIDSNTLIGLAGMPFVLAAVQLIKPFIKDSRWYSPLSVIIAVTLNILLICVFSGTTLQLIVNALMTGFITGLAASGLYSTGKTYTESKSNPTIPPIQGNALKIEPQQLPDTEKPNV
jgi:ABC-type uncharacterized transport system permease subunit